MFEKLKKVSKIYWLLLMTAVIGGVNIFYSYGRISGGGGDELLVINSVLKFFRDFSLADKYETFLPGVIILYIPFIAVVLAGYLFFGLGNIDQLKEMVILDTYKFMPYFRLIAVIFGIVTVYIFYKICLEVFKKERPSLIAAYLLATSLLFIQQIHSAAAWLPQMMMILISVYYSLILLRKQKWHIFDFVISAVLIVLAIGVETVGLIAVIPFLLVCLERRKDMKLSHWIINLSLFSLLIILGVVFFYYLNPVTFRLYFSMFSDSTQLGLSQTVTGRNIWGRVFDAFWIMIMVEPLLFVLTILGIIIAFRKNRFILKFFGLYAFLYYLVLGPLLGGMSESRLSPIIPALVVFAALFIDSLSNKKIIYASLLIFLINPLLFDSVLLKKGSVLEARKWIYENIPVNSSILDECRLELNENKEILNEIAENYPSFLTTRRKYLLDNPDIFAAQKGYFVKDKDIISTADAKKFQYLAICYFSEKDKIKLMEFLQKTKRVKIYDSAAGQEGVINVNMFYLTNFPNSKRFGLFSLFNVPYFGPNVEIYALF